MAVQRPFAAGVHQHVLRHAGLAQQRRRGDGADAGVGVEGALGALLRAQIGRAARQALHQLLSRGRRQAGRGGSPALTRGQRSEKHDTQRRRDEYRSGHRPSFSQGAGGAREGNQQERSVDQRGSEP